MISADGKVEGHFLGRGSGRLQGLEERRDEPLRARGSGEGKRTPTRRVRAEAEKQRHHRRTTYGGVAGGGGRRRRRKEEEGRKRKETEEGGEGGERRRKWMEEDKEVEEDGDRVERSGDFGETL